MAEHWRVVVVWMAVLLQQQQKGAEEAAWFFLHYHLQLVVEVEDGYQELEGEVQLEYLTPARLAKTHDSDWEVAELVLHQLLPESVYSEEEVVWGLALEEQQRLLLVEVTEIGVLERLVVVVVVVVVD